MGQTIRKTAPNKLWKLILNYTPMIHVLNAGIAIWDIMSHSDSNRIKHETSIIIWLTDGLCCTQPCSSHSHYILCSHWHTVIARGRIWGWLECVATLPRCAPGNVHILSIHQRSSLESDLVLCDVAFLAWTCFLCIHRILEEQTDPTYLL